MKITTVTVVGVTATMGANVAGIFASFGNAKAFQIHGDGEPMLLYYEGNGTRGINVVMKRDIAQDKHFANTLPQGQYYDFASPYGYGGWIIEGQDVSELDAEYQKYCKQNSIVSEFVRFHCVILHNNDF